MAKKKPKVLGLKFLVRFTKKGMKLRLTIGKPISFFVIIFGMNLSLYFYIVFQNQDVAPEVIQKRIYKGNSPVKWESTKDGEKSITYRLNY